MTPRDLLKLRLTTGQRAVLTPIVEAHPGAATSAAIIKSLHAADPAASVNTWRNAIRASHTKIVPHGWTILGSRKRDGEGNSSYRLITLEEFQDRGGLRATKARVASGGNGRGGVVPDLPAVRPRARDG